MVDSITTGSGGKRLACCFPHLTPVKQQFHIFALQFLYFMLICELQMCLKVDFVNSNLAKLAVFPQIPNLKETLTRVVSIFSSISQQESKCMYYLSQNVNPSKLLLLITFLATYSLIKTRLTDTLASG